MLKIITEQAFIEFADKFNLESVFITEDFNHIRYNNEIKQSNFAWTINEELIITAKVIIVSINNKKKAIIPGGFIYDYKTKGVIKVFIKHLVAELKNQGVSGLDIEFPVVPSLMGLNELEIKDFNTKIYNILKENKIVVSHNRGDILAHKCQIVDLKNKNNSSFVKKANDNSIEFMEINADNNYKYLNDLESKFTNKQINYLITNSNVKIYSARFLPQAFLKNNANLLQQEINNNHKLNDMLSKRSHDEDLYELKIKSDEKINNYKRNMEYAGNLVNKHIDIALTTMVSYHYKGTIYIIGEISNDDGNLSLFNARELMINHIINDSALLNNKMVYITDIDSINNQETLSYKGTNNNIFHGIQKVLSIDNV